MSNPRRPHNLDTPDLTVLLSETPLGTETRGAGPPEVTRGTGHQGPTQSPETDRPPPLLFGERKGRDGVGGPGNTADLGLPGRRDGTRDTGDTDGPGRSSPRQRIMHKVCPHDNDATCVICPGDPSAPAASGTSLRGPRCHHRSRPGRVHSVRPGPPVLSRVEQTRQSTYPAPRVSVCPNGLKTGPKGCRTCTVPVHPVLCLGSDAGGYRRVPTETGSSPGSRGRGDTLSMPLVPPKNSVERDSPETEESRVSVVATRSATDETTGDWREGRYHGPKGRRYVVVICPRGLSRGPGPWRVPTTVRGSSTGSPPP